MIRYCTYIDKPRWIEDADKDFFKIMAQSRSDVPIILVVTKKDEYEDKVSGKKRRELRSTGLSRDDIDQKVEEEVISQMKLRRAVLEKAFREIPNANFIGPVFISQGK
jgi:hypothetical protein